jgi:acetyltransferase-like isoleucine patch superfamily enzyme
VIEDFCCVNNAVGEIRIGDHTRIGLHNTVIGPVRIGSDVNLAQGVVVSGLNHRFADPGAPIARQGVNTALTVIDDDVWIGANAVVTAGVHIGRHSVIGAGSVVTKDVPAGSVAVGNPARVIKSILPSEKNI